jgi:predicted membrane protein
MLTLLASIWLFPFIGGAFVLLLAFIRAPVQIGTALALTVGAAYYLTH